VLQSSLMFQLYFLFFHYHYLSVLIHLLWLPALTFYLKVDLVYWWCFHLNFLMFENYISRILIWLFLKKVSIPILNSFLKLFIFFSISLAYSCLFFQN
jgi:hypothetical protein